MGRVQYITFSVCMNNGSWARFYIALHHTYISDRGAGGDSLVVNAVQGVVLLHGVLTGVRGVDVGGQGARLPLFLLCGFDLN